MIRCTSLWAIHNSWFSKCVTYSMNCSGNFWRHASYTVSRIFNIFDRCLLLFIVWCWFNLFLFISSLNVSVKEYRKDYKVMAFSLVDPRNLIWCIYDIKYSWHRVRCVMPKIPRAIHRIYNVFVKWSILPQYLFFYSCLCLWLMNQMVFLWSHFISAYVDSQWNLFSILCL